jgi:hypothetical protein
VTRRVPRLDSKHQSPGIRPITLAPAWKCYREATLRRVTTPSPVIRWKKDVVAHDFDAAEAYLSIRLTPERAKALVKRLRDAPLTRRRANDILRASGREPLPLNDPGVLRDLVLVAAGQKLSPVLVVSFDDGADIADGYHRVSLTYALDPFGPVPVRIATVSR